jgi:DNA-binding NarL/FixJ family response regulator
MSAVGVLTVHHEEDRRRMIRAVVAGTPGFHPAGEAASAEEALELALAIRPGLALVARDLPGIDGQETGERLRAALPELTVVVLDDSEAEALTPATLQALWEENSGE